MRKMFILYDIEGNILGFLSDKTYKILEDIYFIYDNYSPHVRKILKSIDNIVEIDVCDTLDELI